MSSLALVTGGAGFIGSHLVVRLLDQGTRVRVLERPGASVSHLPLDRIDVIFVDIRDRAGVARVIDGCAEVYHLAANPQLWTRRKGHFYQVNTLGARNVLEEAQRLGVPRILHTSTESILTRARQTAPIAEDQQVPPRDVIGPYCRSKYHAERLAFRLASAGAPIVIVNPTLPVGPGDHGCSPPTRMMLDCCLGKRSAYLDAELNLIDVRDVAEGMVRAMRCGIPGRRYLLGAENWTVKEVFDYLARTMGVPPPTWCVPYPLALMTAYVSEWIADVFTGEVPAATVTGVKLTRRVMRFDPSRSLAELGLQPRPVEQSIADTVRWFREMAWLKRSGV